MKYKTRIVIVSEAGNKNEAIEIVGEYLSGNLVSGVEMKCLTMPVRKYNKYILSTAAVLLLILIPLFSALCPKHSQNSASGIGGSDAIQVPLTTSIIDARKDMEFRRAWQDKETIEALKLIKKR